MTRIGIIGTGNIAATHIKSFLRFKDRCEVKALADIYPEKGEKMAKENGLSADVYKDYADMLGRPDIDLVSICLPPSAHAEAAVAALEAGKHVIMEKPMAPSLEECDAMIEAAERNGKLLSVIAQNRYKVPMMKVNRMLREGKLGRVLHTTVTSYWWRGQNYYDLWWRGTWEKEGGGCTLNHAVHHIDLLRWNIGMPEEVLAVITNANHLNSEVEDLSVAILRYPDNTLAQLTASLVAHGEEQELVFHTEKARISVPWKVRASKPLPNGFQEDDPDTEKEIDALYRSLPEIEYEGHLGQIDNILSAVEGKADLLIDGREGRATMELILAFYKSAIGRCPVKLPLPKDDPFYRKGGAVGLMPRFHKKSKNVDNLAGGDITLGRDVGR